MKDKHKFYVMGKPLCYYTVSLFIGCFVSMSFSLNSINRLIGAVITASFLLIILLTVDKPYLIIMVGFFILGMVNFYLYFNINLPENNSIYVRIIEDKGFYKIGKYNNRKIILKNLDLNIEEGCKIKVNGQFKSTSQFSKGIIGEYEVNQVLEYKKGFKYKLLKIKEEVYKSLKDKLGREKSAVIMALCFGENKYLSDDAKEDFQKLGVVHASCVSGFHMAVIFFILQAVGGLTFAGVISIFYIIFTGGKPSTIRAFIMILILKFSSKLFRNYDSISSISFAALLLLIRYPYYIVDVGFNLSFLAVLGIILFNNKLSKALYKLPSKVNKAWSLSISSQIFSMPYAAIIFNKFSLGFLIGNLILLPIFSIIIILGNLSLVFYKINPLFNMLCCVLRTILTICDGAQYLLLKISPPIIHFSYIDVIIYMNLLISFIMVKKGMEMFMYFPVFMVVMVMVQNFILF